MKEIASPYTNIYKAVATQAIRQANNYADFISAIQDATDIKVDVIDGLEEARLSQLGMSLHFKNQDEIYLSVDIGGGSTEIIASKGDKIIFMTSFKLGALVLTKRFLRWERPVENKLDLCEIMMMRLAPLLMESNSTLQCDTLQVAPQRPQQNRFKIKLPADIRDIQGYILESDNLVVIENCQNCESHKNQKRIRYRAKEGRYNLSREYYTTSHICVLYKKSISPIMALGRFSNRLFHRVGALNKRQSGHKVELDKGISSQLARSKLR